mmetsp:Transcript_37973/g.114772  ORF Transcript_37973/g.114772 Transcript_37973/m.114772 type:complete len:225 (-) Transcript_37973:2630-3304(-)
MCSPPQRILARAIRWPSKTAASVLAPEPRGMRTTLSRPAEAEKAGTRAKGPCVYDPRHSSNAATSSRSSASPAWPPTPTSDDATSRRAFRLSMKKRSMDPTSSAILSRSPQRRRMPASASDAATACAPYWASHLWSWSISCCCSGMPLAQAALVTKIGSTLAAQPTSRAYRLAATAFSRNSILRRCSRLASCALPYVASAAMRSSGTAHTSWKRPRERNVSAYT